MIPTPEAISNGITPQALPAAQGFTFDGHESLAAIGDPTVQISSRLLATALDNDFFFSVFAVIGHYGWVLVIAFLFSVISTPILRKVAVAYNIIDHPDEVRKHHRRPIAYLGGVGIFIGWLAGVAYSLTLTSHVTPDAMADATPILTRVSFPASILLGALVIVIIGLIDDIHGVSPRIKIGGQLFAAAALALQDVGEKLAFEFLRAGGIALPEPIVYAIGAAIIAIFVLGGCNAVNLIDGLDGLASGVIAIACIGFLFLAGSVAVQNFDTSYLQATANSLYPGDPFSDPARIVLSLALLGGLLGFLVYNFNPASIFMGDTGSLLLGFLSVSILLLFAHTAESGPRLVIASLFVLGLPITDTLLAIIRRKVHGSSIFDADNQHIHHKFIRMGLSVKQSVLALYGVAILFAIIGSLMTLPFVRLRHAATAMMIWFTAVIILGVVMGIRRKRAILSEKGRTTTTTSNPHSEHAPLSTETPPADQ